ncbi:MAG: metallophosphoesterase [Thermoplasmataceae archaeon]
MKELQIEKDVYLSELGCIYLSDESSVVISDLHLGFEEEMNIHGLYLPRLQREHVERTIEKIIERYSPRRIIINGDFKQEFSRNLSQEWTDVIHFIERFEKKVELTFIRGNHDNYLKTILSKKNIELNETYENEKYYIYHGDTDRSFRKLTILGHEHPSIVLRDKVGGMFKIPAFVYNEESRIAITPALSFFSSGTDVTESLISEEHFTPVLKHINSEKFRVFGITEEFGIVDFGYLFDLQKNSKEARYFS